MAAEGTAIWSAVAASFAATSSLLIWRIHRRNLLESARPELVLLGWCRKSVDLGVSAHEIIAFDKLRNVGRGPALNITLNALKFTDTSKKRVIASMPTTRFPIVASGETTDIKLEITIWWNNVERRRGFPSKWFDLDLTIEHTDVLRTRRETTYTLLIHELAPIVFLSDPIAPGLSLLTRRTRSTPLWKIQLAAKGGRLKKRIDKFWNATMTKPGWKTSFRSGVMNAKTRLEKSWNSKSRIS